MNQLLFDMENNFPIPESAAGEEIMELVWQNGAVVVQGCRGGQGGDAVRELRSSCEEQQHPFMQEDGTASWLQYALDESSFDRDSYVDLFNSPPPPRNNITAIVQPAQDPKIPPRLHNFMPSSRLPSSSRISPMRRSSETTARVSTVVESNETPSVGAEVSSAPVNTESVAAAALGGINPVTDMESIAVIRQHSLTSSSGGSGASVDPSPPPPQKLEMEAAEDVDGRRKGREDEDSECQSEDTEFEATKVDKKQAPGSKRYRSAEIHNLSERKRRDRINEKMKALQDLIPGSNKTDKASMLDDAIQYFKSLQMQVQMMSNMGCGMVPMMYPSMQQQYIHAMGMGMGMGMNRPIAPYPPLLSTPTMPSPAAAVANTGLPRFPFPPPQVPVPDPSRIQVSNQADPNDPRAQNFVNPYPQYLGLQQAQDQAVGQSSGTKPTTSKENSNSEKQ